MPDKILAVDDELDILELVEMSLTSDGYDVVTACDGPEALIKAKADPPDLILLDLMMPGMDGFEVIERLRQDSATSDIPVIMLTAKAQADDRVQGLSAGADDYITKPFDLRELTLRVEAALTSTRKTRYINPLMGVMGETFSEESVEMLGHHLEMAADIQRNLLPKEPPRFDGIDIAGMLRTSMTVSGDFYDFVPLDEENIGVAIADIRGKGVGAALLMVMVRTALRLVCREETSPARVLKRINDILALDTAPELFATIVYGVLNTESLTFTYSNAGHCYPVRVHGGTGQISYLDKGGMLLGIFDFAEFESDTVFLEQGDLIFFYTDGLTEAESADGEMYEEERLVAFLNENAHLTADQICANVEEELVVFSGKEQRADDLTMIVFKIEKGVQKESGGA